MPHVWKIAFSIWKSVIFVWQAQSLKGSPNIRCTETNSGKKNKSRATSQGEFEPNSQNLNALKSWQSIHWLWTMQSQFESKLVSLWLSDHCCVRPLLIDASFRTTMVSRVPLIFGEDGERAIHTKKHLKKHICNSHVSHSKSPTVWAAKRTVGIKASLF